MNNRLLLAHLKNCLYILLFIFHSFLPTDNNWGHAKKEHFSALQEINQKTYFAHFTYNTHIPIHSKINRINDTTSINCQQMNQCTQQKY